MAGLFSGISPYQFAYNNPIYFNDPTGLAAENKVDLPLSTPNNSLTLPTLTAGFKTNIHYAKIKQNTVNSLAIFVSNLQPENAFGTQIGMTKRVDTSIESKWQSEIVSSFTEIPIILQSYFHAGNKIDNLIIFTHGGTNKPSILSGENERRFIAESNINNNKDVKALHEAVKYMSNDGTIIFAACYVAWWGTDFPILLKNKILGGNPNSMINMYFSKGKVTFDFLKDANKDEYLYQVPLEKPIRNSAEWVHIPFGYGAEGKLFKSLMLHKDGRISIK